MILTTHILSGAVVGAEIKNPYAVAGLAVVLHFLLDLLPHGDYLDKKSSFKDFWKVAIDLAIGFSIVSAAVLFRGLIPASAVNIQNIAIGIFFSLLPDGTTVLCWKLGIRFFDPIYRFHQKLHRAPDFSPERRFRLKNNLLDIAISLASLLILLFPR